MNQNDLFSKIIYDVKIKGFMADEDRFNLQSIVGEPIFSYFSKPVNDYERTQIYEIEIKNLHKLSLTIMTVLQTDKPETLLPELLKDIFLPAFNENFVQNNNFTKVDEYGLKVGFVITYIMSNLDVKNGIKIQGKIPTKGIFGFRQMDANRWWVNYCENICTIIKLILKYTNNDKEKALCSGWANMIFYLCKSQPHRFYFLKNEVENDGIYRNLVNFLKYCSSFEPVTNKLSIADTFKSLH